MILLGVVLLPQLELTRVSIILGDFLQDQEHLTSEGVETTSTSSSSSRTRTLIDEEYEEEDEEQYNDVEDVDLQELDSFDLQRQCHRQDVVEAQQRRPFLSQQCLQKRSPSDGREAKTPLELSLEGGYSYKVKCFTWLVIKRACLTQEVLQKKGRQLVLGVFYAI